MNCDASPTPKNKRTALRTPAYRRIEEDIRAKVRDGRLPAGTMLMGRHNLAKEYGVALSTAQQAVSNLIADGILETSDRRGTFVSHPVRQQDDAAHAIVTEANGISALRQVGDPIHSATQIPSALLSTEKTSATLGIVATARIEAAGSPDVGSLWARLAIRSLEHVFSAAGGATRYFDRYPAKRGPYPQGLNEANAFTIPQAIAALLKKGAGAIAVVGLCDAADMSDEVVRAIDLEKVPTVYISWHEVQPPLSQVFYDNRFAGYQAVQHLLRQGYRKLVFMAPFADAWLAERIQGARDAVRHASLPEDTLHLYPVQPPSEAYDRRIAQQCVQRLAGEVFASRWNTLFSRNESEPIAIIAPNDDTAYAILDIAAKHGQTAGRDFGLIGFDDDSRACAVGLTTIRPPVEAMGEEAGRLLLGALQGDRKGHQMRMRSHLIARASTQPVLRAAPSWP